jgi:hypothetical protein
VTTPAHPNEIRTRTADTSVVLLQWDSCPREDLTAWLDGTPHTFEDDHLVLTADETQEVSLKPGWYVVRWPDGTVTGASPRSAARHFEALKDAPAPAEPFVTACRTTQHCAHHGWCRRCDPAFAAVMSKVNIAIQHTDADESHWGPLYEAVGQALHEAVAPSADRAALRDHIAKALWSAAEHNVIAEWICCDPIDPKHGLCVQGDAALRMLKALIVDDPEAWKPAPLPDAVLAALPAPAAVPAPAEPFPIWTVWREEQPAYGYFAAEDIAKQASIDCWEEDEPACPDYSWRPDGGPGNWELLVGDERAEVYIRRHLVWGGLPQPPRATVLTEAATFVEAMNEGCGGLPCESCTTREDVAMELRRLAGEAAPKSPAYTRLKEAAATASREAAAHALRGMRNVFQLTRRYGSGPIPAAEVLDALGLDENANTIDLVQETAHPAHESWIVELLMADGHWASAFPTHDRDRAFERLAGSLDRSPDRRWRLVRLSETYTVIPTCPGCANDLTGCASDGLARLVGDDRPYCSAKCAITAAHRTPQQDEPAIRCNWARTRWPHPPHTWEPQPDMDPVPCPGHTTESD